MKESAALETARRHLGVLEASILDDQSEYHLDEALSLLESLVAEGGAEAAIAGNLGRTYVARIESAIRDTGLAAGDVPEPVLERLLNLIRSLAPSDFAPEGLADLHLQIGVRYIDAVFEGYPQARKDAVLAQILDAG